MLITLKAKFENGSVAFLDKVPFNGNCEVLVTFLTEQGNTFSVNSQHQEELINHFRESILTIREVEVLKHAQQGLKNNEIASILELGTGTTRNYLSSIYCKLDARNRSEAIQKGLELGLLEPPESYW